MALQVTEAGDSSCPFEGCETGKTSLLHIVDPDAPLLVGGPRASYIPPTAVWGLGIDWKLTEATWYFSLCVARSL